MLYLFQNSMWYGKGGFMWKKTKVPILFILLFVIGCTNIKIQEKKFEDKYSSLLSITENDISVDINEYSIYGKHFNLKGKFLDIKNFEDVKIVLKSQIEELEYDIYLNNDAFMTNEYINRGILLENIPIGNYLVLLKINNNGEIKYYNLINKTKYNDLVYYTITKNNKNNKIVIDYDRQDEKEYMFLEVTETKLPENIYDIIIDPGHGGNDSGAINGKYREDEINLEYGLMIRDALTDLGLKVKLTRDDDISLKVYGHESRTAIPYEAKAKLMLSIHLNSSNTYTGSGGVEVYTATGDDPYFAKSISDNIVENTSTVYSSNSYNRIEKGVYVRVYSKEDIDGLIEEAQEEKWEPYDIDDSTTYYYFIRETGGIITKAFADGRNPKYEKNPYYDANYGVEAYLLELGYISNSKNLKILLNEKNKYVKAITTSVKDYIENSI